MPTPESTSAEKIHLYASGTVVGEGKGPSWKDVHLTLLALPSVGKPFVMPAVTEPMIVWTTSGEAIAEERESDGPWVQSHLKKGSLFVTAAGAPYEFRWRCLTDEPMGVMILLFSLPLFNEALKDVFRENAPHARLRDVSGFRDEQLIPLLEQLRTEALRSKASRVFVSSIARAVCVHLARNYTALTKDARGETSALPGFKLKRITDWMAENLQEEFSLRRLAEQAEMSEFHFNRLFKRATGMPPSQYQIRLRLDAARRLLRETRKSVISIANEVGYSNPSHFARLFRKETGLAPSDYRRQR